MKVCSRCRVPLDLDCFYLCAASPDGHQYHCKSCGLAYARERVKRQVNLRRAMWHGTLSCKPNLEKIAEEIQAESRARMVKVRRRPEKVAPNVALLLEQLGVPRGVVTTEQPCEKG